MTPAERPGSLLPGPARGPVLAVDFGGTQLRVAATLPDGSLLARRVVRTPLDGGPAAVVGEIRALLESVERSLPDDVRAALLGIGVSSPGPLLTRTGRLVDPPNLGPAFHGLPLAGAISDAVGRPAFVERDTQVAALAEGAFGAARGLSDFVYLTVSTGIGGAVVIGGRLLEGPDGVAGELGHLPVDMDGPPCGCGAAGHLEAMSSGIGIAAAASRAIEAGAAPGLAELAVRLRPAPLEAVHVAAAEDAGDEAARSIMERARAAFAAAMVGLVDVFNPDRVVVGGSVARNQGERWLGPAREAVERFAFRTPAGRAELVHAGLGDDVGLVGALPLVLARLPADADGTT